MKITIFLGYKIIKSHNVDANGKRLQIEVVKNENKLEPNSANIFYTAPKKFEAIFFQNVEQGQRSVWVSLSNC